LKKVVKRSVQILTYLVLFGLVVSYISVWINPATFWFPALFGLFYPYLLIINIILFVFWAWHKKRIAILILFILILGWGHFKNNIQIFGKGHKSASLNSNLPDTASISIMSYNVRSFNYYEASPVKKSQTFIVDLIHEMETGIVCLQEILIHSPPGFSESKLKSSLSSHPYSHMVFSSPTGHTRRYGIGIFSNYPIVNKGEIRFENTHNQCIFIDIRMGTDTIRIYNVHLQSFQLGTTNFKFLTEFERADEDEPFDELQDISLIMKKALVKRSYQAQALSEHIHTSPYPVIVCGDFNDTPVSYVYHHIRKGLKDAFVEAGRGLGKTYSQIFPSYRIDYILYSRSMKALDFKTMHADYSDHYPVSATLLMDPKR